MRIECKLLKAALKEKFPENKFSLSYVMPSDYRFSSDKILVKTDAPYEVVQEFMMSVTDGINVSRKGQLMVMSGLPGCTGICGYNDSEVEFIEIDAP